MQKSSLFLQQPPPQSCFPLLPLPPPPSQKPNPPYLSVTPFSVLALPTMQSFTFLKHWTASRPASAFNTTTSSTAAVAEIQTETHDPFFDLDFSVSDEDEPLKQGTTDDDEHEQEQEQDEEFNFTISSGSTNQHSDDSDRTFSPSSGDLFFKGNLVPVEASSNGGDSSDQPNSSPQLRVTFLKSAAKFRVFLSGLKKLKPNEVKKTETDGSDGGESKTKLTENPPENEVKQSITGIPPEINENPPEKTHDQPRNKFLAVKFNMEEVPIMSLFARDSSSKNNKQQKQSSDESAIEDNRFSKEVIMQKYLKMVKPMYIRVSRRYGQLILGVAGDKSGEPPPAAAVEVEAPTTTTVNSKGLNMPAKLRVVCKHLGKSRSGFAAVAAAPPGLAPSRKDDSLLQQEDGIQSAILHCKRSFNSSRAKTTTDSEPSLLSRSVSDTQPERPSDLTEKAID